MFSLEGLIITIGFIIVLRVAIVGTLNQVRDYRMIREYERLFPEVWGKEWVIVQTKYIMINVIPGDNIKN